MGKGGGGSEGEMAKLLVCTFVHTCTYVGKYVRMYLAELDWWDG